MSKDTTRILLIRLKSIGDTLLMTPAPVNLLKAYPDAHITLVSEEKSLPVLQKNPFIHKILVIRTSKGSFTRFIDLVKTFYEICRHRYDITINFHGNPLSALMTLASRARKRSGFGYYRFSFVYNNKVPSARRAMGIAQGSPIHAVRRQLALVASLGIDCSYQAMSLILDNDEIRWGADFLKNHNLRKGKTLIILNPHAARDSKRWSATSFAELGDILARDYNCDILVAGDPSSPGLSEEVSRKMTCSHTMVYEGLDLRRLASLIFHCDLYVGNDTGPTHFAAAFNKKVVAIFGCTDPDIWGPWCDQHRIVRVSLACSPCRGQCEYGTNECIHSISTKQVLNAVTALLEPH